MSEVLDISASPSPYHLSARENGASTPRSVSSQSLDRHSRSIGEQPRDGEQELGEVTWKMEEVTLSRGTGATLPKESGDEPRDSTTTAGEEDEEKDWHPLQGPGNNTQDTTVVVDLGDSIVDSTGRLLFTDGSTRTSPSPSRRTSGVKTVAPSPPPWEVIQPPSNNGHREFGGGAKILRASQSRRLIPKSSYYSGPPPADTAFGTMPVGHIGVHHPREIIRVERDYTGGELIQFAPIYPLELEGRITPTQFLESINAINERLIEAHSLSMAMFDNVLAVVTMYLSRLVAPSHYDKEMRRLKDLFEELNTGLYNPAGLHLLWPGDVAFLFMEIEYY